MEKTQRNDRRNEMKNRVLDILGLGLIYGMGLVLIGLQIRSML